jgi:hypothetical protein
MARRNEASAHFRRGVELFREQAFRAALVELQRANELEPDYRILFNIGQTKFHVQDYLGATQSYELYLSQGGHVIPAERRAQVEEALASLRERVGRIGVTVNRHGAEVFVDDANVGTAPMSSTILANVGRHRVLARSADGASDARTVDVAGGDVVEVSLVLAAPRGEPGIAHQAEQPARVWSMKRKLAVVNWSAGALLLGAGAATGTLASKANDELKQLLETPDVSQSNVSEERSTLRALALSTDVLVATGAAAAAVGTLFWLLDRHSERSPTAGARVNLAWDVGLGSMQVRGRF